MRQCRAKMIDGSSVTFEWGPEEVVQIDGHPNIRVDCIGHGFHVRSESYAYDGGEALRFENMRAALRWSGVDTATVEYLDYEKPERITGFLFRCRAHWVPVFPPVLKEAPASRMPGMITYINAEPTAEMMEAGMAEGMACWARSIGNRETIRRVWCAMEKARR